MAVSYNPEIYSKPWYYGCKSANLYLNDLRDEGSNLWGYDEKHHIRLKFAEVQPGSLAIFNIRGGEVIIEKEAEIKAWDECLP